MGWRSSSKSLHTYQSTQLLTMMMMITFTNMVKEVVVVVVVGEMQKFFKFASYISVHSNFDNDDDVSVWLVLAN